MDTYGDADLAEAVETRENRRGARQTLNIGREANAQRIVGGSKSRTENRETLDI